MGNLTRKFVAVLVSLTMVFCSAAFAFADSASPDGGSDEPDTKPAAAAKITSSNSTVNYSSKSIKVTFSGKNAVKYKIGYRVKGGTWKYVTTTNKYYTIKGLKANKLYQFKIAGINKDGKVGKYTTIKGRYMRKSNFTASGQKGKVKVTTKKLSGVSGYQIRYASKKSMSGYKTVTVKTTKALSKVLKLKKGTYWVQVRPFKTVDGKRYVGTYSKKVKVKVS